MFSSLTTQQIGFFFVLAAAMGLLLTERVRNDLVALLIILGVYLIGALDSKKALAGFGSEPAIVVAGIFVLSGAFHKTGLAGLAGRWIDRAAQGSFNRITAVVMGSVAILSAFTHHLTTTAMMLPVTLDLSRKYKIAPSKLLMPLSFAASLGTAITVIGAPAFLIASDVLQRAGRPGLGILSIAPIGLAITAAGILFVLLVGRFLLPEREGGPEAAHRFRLDEYLTELTILEDSPYLEMTAAEAEARGQHHFKTIGWLRGGRSYRYPFTELKLQAGDVLLVRATPEELASIRQDRGVELHPVVEYGSQTSDRKEDQPEMVQAVISPTSELIGRTLGTVDFRRRYGALVLGLWRRHGWFDKKLSDMSLRAGDVLVLEGTQDALDRVAQDPNFLLMLPFQGEAGLRRKGPLVAGILLGTILAAAFGWMSIEMAAVAGAVACVLTGCITPRQAYESVDTQIYIFIAGTISLGAAMEATGTSKLLAGWMQGAVQGWDQRWILLALFAVVGVVTQLMSDAATTALFAPVAAALAQSLGHAPEAYVVTVAMAAVVSFLTPIGHHGNLLIYGPGRYRFKDFVVVGTPLTVLIAVIVVLLAPMLWRA